MHPSPYSRSLSRGCLLCKGWTLKLQRNIPSAKRFLSHSEPEKFSQVKSLSDPDHERPTKRDRRRYDLLFCGTDNFALPVLQRLVKEKELFNSIQVLTPPDTVQKWGAKRMRVSPVKRLAESLGLTSLSVPSEGLEHLKLPPPFAPSSTSTDSEEKRKSTLNTTSHPLLVTASFGHYLPPAFLSRFPSRQVLNLHPSLLPKLRGAAPIQWAIARQIKNTGVSVQRIEGEGWDVGDVLGSEPFSLPSGADYLSMEPILANLGSELLISVIQNLEECSLRATPQDHSAATRAPKIKRAHVEVRWKEWDAIKVEARSRAMGYMFPLSTTLVPSRVGKGVPTSSLRVLLPNVSVLKSTQRDPPSANLQKELSALSESEIPYGTAIFSEELGCLIAKCPPVEAEAESETQDHGSFPFTSALQDAPPCSFLLVHSLKTDAKQERKARDWFVGYKDRADQEGRLRFEFQTEVAK